MVMPCTDASLPLLLLGITSERRKPFWRDDASPGWKMELSFKLSDHGLECSSSNWSPTISQSLSQPNSLGSGRHIPWRGGHRGSR